MAGRRPPLSALAPGDEGVRGGDPAGSDESIGRTTAPRRSAGRHRIHLLRRLFTWLSAAVILLVTASLAGLLPVQVMRVDSDSMVPTLADGDVVVVERWAEHVRGQLVAVWNPSGGGLLVKRAVAVAGDEVAIEDGVLLVNGGPVCEPTIDPARLDGVYFGPEPVPASSLFLLGDNRGNSIDSRHFGPVGTGDVVGVVRTRLWPAAGGLTAGGLAAGSC